MTSFNQERNKGKDKTGKKRKRSGESMNANKGHFRRTEY